MNEVYLAYGFSGVTLLLAIMLYIILRNKLENDMNILE